MSDLNCTVFYKTKFQIICLEKDEDYLWKIVCHIRFWQTSKWIKRNVVIANNNGTWSDIKFGSKLWSDDKNTVYIESDYFKDKEKNLEYWACKIVEKCQSQKGVCPRHWVTEIGFEQIDEKTANFSCVISYSDVPGFIGPVEDEPSPNLPNIITRIIRDEKLLCCLGKDRIEVNARELKVGGFPIFLEELQNSKRELPYIYISPVRDKDTDEVKTLIRPYELARAVCGNAVVYHSQDMSFSDEMDYMCPKGFTCNNGKIRIYFPHVDMSEANEGYRNIIIFPSTILENGEEYIIKIFRRALAQNINYYETYFRLDNVRKKRSDVARQYRLDKIKEEFENKYSDLQESALADALREEQDKIEAENHAEWLSMQLSEKETEVYNLSSQLEYMRTAYEKSREMETALNERNNFVEYPDCPERICSMIESLFKDKIAFSVSAKKSLKYCTIANGELWRVLFSLAVYMSDIMAESKGDPYKEFKHRTGIDCSRSEGMMTRKDKKLMEQFVTIYDGVEIDIEPHITFPREKQSIHFGFDNRTKKIIIGHCGQHMEIYSTRKMK